MKKIGLAVIASVIILCNSQAFAKTYDSAGLIIGFILINYSEIVYEANKGKGDYIESLINELLYPDKEQLLIYIKEYIQKYDNSYEFAKNAVKDFNKK